MDGTGGEFVHILRTTYDKQVSDIRELKAKVAALEERMSPFAGGVFGAILGALLTLVWIASRR